MELSSWRYPTCWCWEILCYAFDGVWANSCSASQYQDETWWHEERLYAMSSWSTRQLDGRQMINLSNKADHAVYYKAIRGLCPITSSDLLSLLGWWTWIFVKWPNAHVCTSMKEPIQHTASCAVTHVVIHVCWHPKSAVERLRQRTDRSISLAVIDWLQFLNPCLNWDAFIFSSQASYTYTASQTPAELLSSLKCSSDHRLTTNIRSLPCTSPSFLLTLPKQGLCYPCL